MYVFVSGQSGAVFLSTSRRCWSPMVLGVPQNLLCLAQVLTHGPNYLSSMMLDI